MRTPRPEDLARIARGGARLTAGGARLTGRVAGRVAEAARLALQAAREEVRDAVRRAPAAALEELLTGGEGWGDRRTPDAGTPRRPARRVPRGG